MRLRKIIVCLPLLATVGACTVGSDHRSPSLAFTDRYHSARSSTPRDPDAHWWKAFGSPLIDEFVDRGLSQNLRIQQALQRVVEARARLDAVAAAPLSGQAQVSPEASTGQAVVDRFGRNNVIRAGLSSTAAWQIDLFGRLQRQREAGLASLDVARIDVEAAKLQFIAERWWMRSSTPRLFWKVISPPGRICGHKNAWSPRCARAGTGGKARPWRWPVLRH